MKLQEYYSNIYAKYSVKKNYKPLSLCALYNELKNEYEHQDKNNFINDFLKTLYKQIKLFIFEDFINVVKCCIDWDYEEKNINKEIVYDILEYFDVNKEYIKYISDESNTIYKDIMHRIKAIITFIIIKKYKLTKKHIDIIYGCGYPIDIQLIQDQRIAYTTDILSMCFGNINNISKFAQDNTILDNILEKYKNIRVDTFQILLNIIFKCENISCENVNYVKNFIDSRGKKLTMNQIHILISMNYQFNDDNIHIFTYIYNKTKQYIKSKNLIDIFSHMTQSIYFFFESDYYKKILCLYKDLNITVGPIDSLKYILLYEQISDILMYNINFQHNVCHVDFYIINTIREISFNNNNEKMLEYFKKYNVELVSNDNKYLITCNNQEILDSDKVSALLTRNLLYKSNIKFTMTDDVIKYYLIIGDELYINVLFQNHELLEKIGYEYVMKWLCINSKIKYIDIMLNRRYVTPKIFHILYHMTNYVDLNIYIEECSNLFLVLKTLNKYGLIMNNEVYKCLYMMSFFWDKKKSKPIFTDNFVEDFYIGISKFKSEYLIYQLKNKNKPNVNTKYSCSDNIKSMYFNIYVSDMKITNEIINNSINYQSMSTVLFLIEHYKYIPKFSHISTVNNHQGIYLFTLLFYPEKITMEKKIKCSVKELRINSSKDTHITSDIIRDMIFN